MLKKIFGASVALLGLILLSGCVKDPSPVDSSFHKLDVYKNYNHPEVVENEKTHIASESISKWNPLSKSRKVAMDKAEAYCTKMNRKMIVMKEHVANLPYMINHSPRVELTFVCHDNNKKILQASEKSSPVYYEALKTNIIKEKYKNLLFLKKLLDDGALTQKEFDLEKKKLLQEK